MTLITRRRALQFGAAAGLVDAQCERRAVGAQTNDATLDLLAAGSQHAHETARITVDRAWFDDVVITRRWWRFRQTVDGGFPDQG